MLDAALFAGLASGLFMLGVALLKTNSDREKSMSDEADATYRDLCRRVLEPSLWAIIGANRGAFRAREFLETPEVVEKLGSYNAALHGYIEADGRRGAVLMALGLASKASVLTSMALYVMVGISLGAAHGGPLPMSSQPVVLTAEVATTLFGGILVAHLVCKWRSEESLFYREMRAVRRRLP